MPRSEAQKRADKKYNAKRYAAGTYKQLSVKVAPDDYAAIDSFCSEHSISKAKFLVAACKFCIDKGIDFNE